MNTNGYKNQSFPRCHSQRKGGILSVIPHFLVPYAELMRIDKPTGTLVTYLPHLFGVIYAGCSSPHTCSPEAMFSGAVTMLEASFILRSFGCTWNDIMDRDLDAGVERCRSRPLPRGAITVAQASTFCVVEVLAWLGILALSGSETVFYSIPIALMAAVYPLAKRLTDFAQIVLGITFSWGLMIGMSRMGVRPDILAAEDRESFLGLIALFVAYLVWTVIFDTIYAFQDLRDDLKVGVKSMAVRFRHHPRSLLCVLASILISALAMSGFLLRTGHQYYFEACGGVSALLLVLISSIAFEDTVACSWWFQNGSIAFGLSVTLGLAHEYVNRSVAD